MSSEPLTAEQIEELKKRHIRSFCMRRGHISNAQEKALEELLPLYEIPYDANQKFDAVKTFGNNNPLVLEIVKEEGRQLGLAEGLNKGINAFIKLCKDMNLSDEDTINKLVEDYQLSRDEAINAIKNY